MIEATNSELKMRTLLRKQSKQTKLVQNFQDHTAFEKVQEMSMAALPDRIPDWIGAAKYKPT